MKPSSSLGGASFIPFAVHLLALFAFVVLLLPLAREPRPEQITLLGAAGPTRLAEFRGRPLLVYFGYASCPDICPTTLALAARELAALPEGVRPRLLMVTIDPARDDPVYLQRYVRFFDPAFHAVQVPDNKLAALAGVFGARYRRTSLDSGLDYAMDHSADLYLLDGCGQPRRVLSHPLVPGILADAVNRMGRGCVHDRSGLPLSKTTAVAGTASHF